MDDREILMQSDWNNVLWALGELQDRALTGTRLRLKRPAWYPHNGGYVQRQRAKAMQMIDDIFSNAIVDDPETINAEP